MTNMLGKGVFYEAEIIECSKKAVKLKILKKDFRPLPWSFNLHIALAPTKNIDRTEWFLEKAVEIGLNRYTPLRCRHSERKQLRVDRLEKIALAAAKQSQKSFFTKIDDLCDFEEFVHNNQADQKFIAHCQNDNLPELQSIFVPQKDCSVLILVGPEGDFSPEEVSLAISLGFKEISLGKSRLRTETAGVAAVHTIQLLGT